MRIAQVSPLIYPVPPRDQGGTERVVHDLTEALVALGHDVTLFAAEGSKTSGRLVAQELAVADVTDAPPGLPSAVECVMLDRVAAMAHEFDVIHCHTELYHAAVLREHLGKLVTTIHWRADERDRQHYLSHFADLGVVAISASQASAIPERNLRGIVHHGISEKRFVQGDGAGRDCIFLGRMTDQKRPDHAIAIAHAAGMSIRLGGAVDVGNPGYFARKVEPLLGPRARYLGPIADADRQDFFGSAAVLLFPVDWPEPFGLVMIEAMACGTPVVAWRNGSTAEVVDDGVTGFVVETMEEATAAVERAVHLDRKKVRERFELRFGALRMAQEYEAIYESLTSSPFAAVA